MVWMDDMLVFFKATTGFLLPVTNLKIWKLQLWSFTSLKSNNFKLQYFIDSCHNIYLPAVEVVGLNSCGQFLRLRGHSQTTLTRFWFFFHNLPPCVDIFYGMNVDKRWIFMDHLPTSSCKCSLWTTPNPLSQSLPPIFRIKRQYPPCFLKDIIQLFIHLHHWTRSWSISFKIKGRSSDFAFW